MKDDSFDCTLIAHLRIFLLFYRLLYCLILPENRLFFGIWKVAEIECGFYECKKCGNRFLSLQTMNRIPCPECEAEIDYEIGPDESMEDALDTAELLEKIIGEEEVEKMDGLLSLAITGGDCNWI